MAASAKARISSSVRSWMGWGTKTRAAGKPRASGLGLGGVDELGRREEHAGQAPALQISDVVHTARRAGASIGERLDDHVAALGDLVAEVGRGRLGEGRLA